MQVHRVHPSQAAGGQKKDIVQVELSPTEAEDLRWFLVGSKHDRAIKVADAMARNLLAALKDD